MKDNKKYDVADLYYATIIYDEDNKGYGIFKINKNVIDINSEAKYEIKFICHKYIILEDNIKIKGITPFTNVISYMYGKYPVSHILNVDKHVLKEYSDKFDEYVFSDSNKPENAVVIMKNNNMKQISLFLEKIYKLGLTIQNYEIKKLDEEFVSTLDSNKDIFENEVLIMVVNGLNSIEKINKIREEKKFDNDIIHVSKTIKNADDEIKNIFFPKEKQKRI